MGCFQRITDDLVTVSAIAAIGFLAYHGITDGFIIAVIAGLGGYRIYQGKTKEKKE